MALSMNLGAFGIPGVSGLGFGFRGGAWMNPVKPGQMTSYAMPLPSETVRIQPVKFVSPGGPGVVNATLPAILRQQTTGTIVPPATPLWKNPLVIAVAVAGLLLIGGGGFMLRRARARRR